MALYLCAELRIAAARPPRGPITYVQKAFLKNALPAVQIPGISPHELKEDQRFPENITWPEEIEWMNVDGHGKSRPSYQPPDDVEHQLSTVWHQVLGHASCDLDTPIADLTVKHQLLTACASQLGHDVPNSQLHQIRTLGDISRYYTTEVCTMTPLEKLKEQALPKNLHIQTEPVRFVPDADTKFGGISAFPRSSTVVTGLKYKKKFPGHVARKSWPFD